jgi:hypothetical protein
METIFLTSFSTPLRKFCLPGPVYVTPTIETFGSLAAFLAYASSNDPSVAVYEWINWLVGGHACRGSPVKAPVGSHQSLPFWIPCYVKKVNIN